MSEAREILFRGKRMDNGKWVYGSYQLLHVPDRDWAGKVTGPAKDIHCIEDDTGLLRAVDPDTVGQYTGLTDKDGVKIFEGDILFGEGRGAQKDYFVIRWSAACCGFTAGEGKRVWPNLNQATVSSYKVTGNIHDSPPEAAP